MYSSFGFVQLSVIIVYLSMPSAQQNDQIDDTRDL